MSAQSDDRRSGGQTVMLRIVLDRPPDAAALHAVAQALRGSDDVVSSPGLEIEVVLHATTPDAVGNHVLPRVESRLSDRTIRLVQIDGEDVLARDE